MLQSDGELSIASTGKDPATGRLVTNVCTVTGPAAIFLMLTAVTADLDAAVASIRRLHQALGAAQNHLT